ncbi:DUF4384 domain-containing protein [Bradyrhizobium japonicum]
MPSSQPIRQARPWLAFLLLLAGSGAAPAAPLPTASLHVGTTYARWLWPVQAVRGQTNTASVSLQIRPSETVNVGGKVSFGVTARKTGYLILVDVDAEGRMSQIFPTPELLAQSNERDINLVKPGVEFVVLPRRRDSVVLNISSHRRRVRSDDRHPERATRAIARFAGHAPQAGRSGRRVELSIGLDQRATRAGQQQRKAGDEQLVVRRQILFHQVSPVKLGL